MRRAAHLPPGAAWSGPEVFGIEALGGEAGEGGGDGGCVYFEDATTDGSGHGETLTTVWVND